MIHDELHALAQMAAHVAIGEGMLEDDQYQALLAWLSAAADALRLQRLGHHDRELLEFVQQGLCTLI